MKSKFNYLFGPVPSRRLGRSLGIDVTPFKTCSEDCIFCQCGLTTRHTAERAEFVPFKAVCEEIQRWVDEGGEADYITFAGSGEPTLYNRLGELIDFIKTLTDIPVMILSNGTLLYLPEVREDVTKADVVKVSLSAWDDASFKRVNRPAPGLTFEMLVSGERALRSAFSGELWLEVFLMEGINSARSQVEQIAAIAKEIAPDKIHLNTAVRPAAEKTVRAVSLEKLTSLCSCFTPPAEVVASFKSSATVTLQDEELVSLIKRHPATAADLAAMTGAKEEVVKQILAPLVASGELQTDVRNEVVYYK